MNASISAIEQLAIQTALKKLFEQTYFSISTVDEIMRITGSIPDGRIYRALHLLHCVNYRDMPRPLLEQIPELLAECFRGPVLEASGINFVSDRQSGMPRLISSRDSG